MTLAVLNQENPGDVSLNVFVLFSGHNDRAVTTLCRFFSAFDLPFAIVSANRSDAILQTDWFDRVVVARIDRALDIPLFDIVRQAVRGVHGSDACPVYCPTTEFMNHFVLQERDALQQLGWHITLPAAEVYAALTSKVKSQKIIEQLIGMVSPLEVPLDDLRAPCVLKPRSNVGEGKIYYPRLCRTDDELKQALSDCDPLDWFAQTWVDGQSYYLCAYITVSGRYAHFWQQNLLQQPNGKSIVLARTVPNPGVTTEPLFLGLIEKGYHGPFMMEVIRDEAGRFHYIEINPRFWGPLQLALDACPDILRLFVHDAGIRLDITVPSTGVKSDITYWYAWQRGAQLAGCRRYPALVQIELTQSLQDLLDSWDIYAKPDTQLLHGSH